MSEPTAVQLREARRLGAANSLSHLPKAQHAAQMTVHAALDSRREKNISTFVAQVRGGK